MSASWLKLQVLCTLQFPWGLVDFWKLSAIWLTKDLGFCLAGWYPDPDWGCFTANTNLAAVAVAIKFVKVLLMLNQNIYKSLTSFSQQSTSNGWHQRNGQKLMLRNSPCIGGRTSALGTAWTLNRHQRGCAALKLVLIQPKTHREASKQRRDPEEHKILACRQNFECSGKDEQRNDSTGNEKNQGTFGRESTINGENWQQRASLN